MASPVCVRTLTSDPQVLEWRKLMNLDSDDVAVFLDAWGIRRLFSLAVRRRGRPRKSRDPILDEFFQVLEENWGKNIPQGRNKVEDRKAEQVHNMPEEEEVDPDLLSDTEVSDVLHCHLMRAETDEYFSLCTPPKVRALETKVEGNEATMNEELNGMGDIDLDLEEQLLLEKLALLMPHVRTNQLRSHLVGCSVGFHSAVSLMYSVVPEALPGLSPCRRRPPILPIWRRRFFKRQDLLLTSLVL